MFKLIRYWCFAHKLTLKMSWLGILNLCIDGLKYFTLLKIKFIQIGTNTVYVHSHSEKSLPSSSFFLDIKTWATAQLTISTISKPEIATILES